METLTLEQAYYIGELIAAVAVIISLIYVAKEIRQNTNMLRINSSREFVRWNTDLVEPLSSQREVCENWMKGDSDLDSLDEVDKQRAMLFE